MEQLCTPPDQVAMIDVFVVPARVQGSRAVLAEFKVELSLLRRSYGVSTAVSRLGVTLKTPPSLSSFAAYLYRAK
jgi:hypothetical protein